MLSAYDEAISGEDETTSSRSILKDDFGIQRDLIDKKKIYLMTNKKFKKVHPIADRRLVEKFDPRSDKLTNWSLTKWKKNRNIVRQSRKIEAPLT